MRIGPENINPDMLTREGRIGMDRRGTFMPAVAGSSAGTFFNPATVAGNVPGYAGESRRIGIPPPLPVENSPLTDMRQKVEEDWKRARAMNPGMPIDTRPVITGRIGGFTGGGQQVGPGGRMMGSSVVSNGGTGSARPPDAGGQAPGSIVEQMLAGTKTDAGRQPPAPLRDQATPERYAQARAATAGQTEGGVPPSVWGGTMRPITLAPGTSLLDMKQMYGGYENDPVLNERKAEYDRNLADYLRQPPAWQSRADYEKGLATLPGAGTEILGHIQQRALENMPGNMAADWQQTQATRDETAKAITGLNVKTAAYQHYVQTAPADHVAQFQREQYLTPEGKWEKNRIPTDERQREQRLALLAKATANMGSQFEQPVTLSDYWKGTRDASGNLKLGATPDPAKDALIAEINAQLKETGGEPIFKAPAPTLGGTPIQIQAPPGAPVRSVPPPTIPAGSPPPNFNAARITRPVPPPAPAQMVQPAQPTATGYIQRGNQVVGLPPPGQNYIQSGNRKIVLGKTPVSTGEQAPGDESMLVYTPEQARNLKPGTRFKGADGKIRRVL